MLNNHFAETCLNLKVPIIGSETISNNGKPFKNDEKYSLFHIKNSFRSGNIYIFLMRFCYSEKQLDKKINVNCRIYGTTDWTTNNYKTHIAQYLNK